MLGDLVLAMAAAEQHATMPDGRGGSLTVTAKFDALALRTASRRGQGADGGNLKPARASGDGARVYSRLFR